MNVYVKYFKFNFAERKKFLINAIGELLLLPVSFGLYAFLYFFIYSPESVDVINGFDLPMIITYALYLAIFRASLPSSKVSAEISRSIISGTITSIIVKPVSHYWWVFTKTLPEVFISFIVGILFNIILSIIFPTIFILPNIINFLIFFVALFFAINIAYSIHYITGILSFYLGMQWWTRQIVTTLILILGGGLLPIGWYPPAISQVLVYLPFVYILGSPIELLIFPIETLDYRLLISFLWSVILYIISVQFFKHASKRYSSPGG